MISFTSEQLVYNTFMTFQTKKQNIKNTPVWSFQMQLCATAQRLDKVNEQNVVNNNGIIYLQ